jgi:hypothetical protein
MSVVRSRLDGLLLWRVWERMLAIEFVDRSVALAGKAFVAFFLRGALGGGLGVGLFAVVSLAVTSALWWFTAWFLLLGDVRARVLVPTGVITAVAMAAFAVSATVWMPGVVTRNEDQFGFFGVALALVTWFSGAAICVLIGACAGPVLAEDRGPVGALVRHGEAATLTTGARPPLPPPAGELSLRDAFQTLDEP